MAPLTVLYRKDDHIATITLNRPEVRNAVDEAMAASLDEVIHQAAKDDEVWVVVLTANGESFCAVPFPCADDRFDCACDWRRRHNTPIESQPPGPLCPYSPCVCHGCTLYRLTTSSSPASSNALSI